MENIKIIYSFLATGDSFVTLAGRFRVGASTVHRAIKKTCQAVWDILSPTYMKPPTRQDWQRIEHHFSTQWNYPNCIGAIDGKHVVIQVPHNSGSQFFNYKGTFSLVLMALVDADYKFTFVDIGNYGSQSDGAVFKHSSFGQKFINGELDIPRPKALSNYPQGGVLPHCIVGDEAFPCHMDLMRPYPRGKGQNMLAWAELIFNYRLSTARRISENAFGILVQRWRLFNRRINLMPENVDLIIMACVVLHDFLTGERDIPALYQRLNPDNLPYLHDDGAILAVPNLHGFHTPAQAKAIRDIFMTYFNRPEGALPWQHRAALN